MIRAVKIKNLKGDPVVFESGGAQYYIPEHGSMRMSFAEYSQIVRRTDIHELGLEVEMRDVSYKDVSVRDFGAKGDGFTDDTYAIQAAIDYVQDMGGGVVRVPVGVYLVGNISIFGDISLEGESRTESIIKAKAGIDDAILSIEGATANVTKLRLVI